MGTQLDILLGSGGATLVTVMQSAHLRDGDNSSAIALLHRPWFGRVLLQRQVRAGFVVISQEPSDLPTQRLFIKDIARVRIRIDGLTRESTRAASIPQFLPADST
jgi:hypothetical protein